MRSRLRLHAPRARVELVVAPVQPGVEVEAPRRMSVGFPLRLRHAQELAARRRARWKHVLKFFETDMAVLCAGVVIVALLLALTKWAP